MKDSIGRLRQGGVQAGRSMGAVDAGWTWAAHADSGWVVRSSSKEHCLLFESLLCACLRQQQAAAAARATSAPLQVSQRSNLHRFGEPERAAPASLLLF